MFVSNKSMSLVIRDDITMDVLKDEVTPIILIRPTITKAYFLRLFDRERGGEIGKIRGSFHSLCEDSTREIFCLSFPNGLNHTAVVEIDQTRFGYPIYSAFMICHESSRFEDVMAKAVPDMEGVVMQDTVFLPNLLCEMDVPWSTHISHKGDFPVISPMFENELIAMEYKLRL